MCLAYYDLPENNTMYCLCSQIATDVVGLVDEWAARFFEELDYINEGENGTRFAEQMKVDLPQVVVAKTYTKYTSRRVLTTEWIEGEKLSQSTASDVGDLVNVGVICYLKQVRTFLAKDFLVSLLSVKSFVLILHASHARYVFENYVCSSRSDIFSMLLVSFSTRVSSTPILTQEILFVHQMAN